MSHRLRRTVTWTCLAVMCWLPLAGCDGDRQNAAAPDDSDTPAPQIATASPYLAAAVRDVAGSDTPLLSMTSPGNCPGHFDVTPRHVEQLAAARLLLRFDFQKHLDAKLSAARDRGLGIAPIKGPEGLGIPEMYRDVCYQIADALIRAELLTPDRADARLTDIGLRLGSLDTEVGERVESANLKNIPVVAAAHQQWFCRYLGLNVVGTFTGSDNPSDLADAVEAIRQADAKMVIGNVPQGQAVPQRIADRGQVTMVMFENFPDPDRPEAFDAMVRANLDRLIQAAPK